MSKLRQDLHIHTVYSHNDSGVVPEQTPFLVSEISHADTIGISDHLDYISEKEFESYENILRSLGIKVGLEINGSEWIDKALPLNTEYFIFHCRDKTEDYKGAEKLLETGKPLIIAHPLVFNTDFSRLPSECFIEVSNRYSWRYNWKEGFKKAASLGFRFVPGSDAHQPNWLNQNAAFYIMDQTGIKETLVFG